MNFTDALRGYRRLTDDQIKQIWSEAVFCFDTNVLLDVYRYTDKSREDFFEVLTKIKGRLFVPARVAEEFARNREKVIRQQNAPHMVIRDGLADILKALDANHSKHRDYSELRETVTKMEALEREAFAHREASYMSLVSNDTVLDKLLTIIGDTAGEPVADDALTKEYETRQRGNIPPYCKEDDKNKDDLHDAAGDIAVWLETLEYFEHKAKRPLIFVTGDTKSNWWTKKRGSIPQPKLIREFFDRTKQDALFYTSERFSETAPGFLGVQVGEQLIEETKTIRQEERQREQTTRSPVTLAELLTYKRGKDEARDRQFDRFIASLAHQNRRHRKWKSQQSFWHHLTDHAEEYVHDADERLMHLVIAKLLASMVEREKSDLEEKPSAPDDEPPKGSDSDDVTDAPETE